MKISCNKLKTHIENSDQIDWLKIWDKFSIRTAEVEDIFIKGEDIKDVVVAEIIKCEKHPTKENYHILEVTDGKKIYNILCGAPNVLVGLKVPLVKIGGTISGFTISEKKIAGILSEGMLCSGFELGINNDSAGILELPEDTLVGEDLKKILPIDDIIIEIDNKSLTNRPDLWGHFGIAREIAAITNNKLIPLELFDINNNLKDLNLKIASKDNCLRYTAIKIENITQNKTPIEMELFLNYVGFRSISLAVDLTNYIMLEMGQPMHAFDASAVNNILVEMAKDGEEFVTLDKVTRKLTKDVLLIKDKEKILGLAGIMGGFDSEIIESSKDIILESATFEATTIRKGSTSLGLRTEASTRYEKSLDPHWCDLAIKRFIYLLKKIDKNIKIGSNLTDIYPAISALKYVELPKEKLTKYMGFELKDETVIQILESLEFNVEVKQNIYKVQIPTFRATKDISMDADIIEEISRMYGYENILEKPLMVESTFKIHETIYDEEYKVKEFLTKKYSASEVHSYLWYDSAFLKECGIEKQNVVVVNKVDNNILRDELSLSLLPFVRNNFKYFNDFIIYEIGTVINRKDNKRRLSIILADNIVNVENIYNKAKLIVKELFKTMKNVNISYELSKGYDYYVPEYGLNIIINNNIIGQINIITPTVTFNLGKKKVAATIEIDFDQFLKIEKNAYEVKELSKFQNVVLDYTIIMDKESNYLNLEKIVNNFIHEYIQDYKLIDVYHDSNFNKYLIRFTLSSNNKTLEQGELEQIKNDFIAHIRNNNLNILE